MRGEEQSVGPCTVGGAGDFGLGVGEVCVTDLSLLHICRVAQSVYWLGYRSVDLGIGVRFAVGVKNFHFASAV